MGRIFGPERRKIILEKLLEQERIIVSDLSKEINVSEATLRSDLTKMEDDGLLVRTHGGAIPISQADSDTSFATREKKNKDEKVTIAKKALSLISNGQCVMLDASSTALELARLLNNQSIRITVVTSGINTALELNEHPDITVILLGGIIKRGSYSLEGSLGINILSQINIDMMFTSANGFTLESGLTDFSVYEVELKKAMVRASNKVIAMLDHSKMNKSSIASFASLDDIDMIVTDYEMPSDYSRFLEDKNIEILRPEKNM